MLSIPEVNVNSCQIEEEMGKMILFNIDNLITFTLAYPPISNVLDKQS
jgi:hypothetical protein